MLLLGMKVHVMTDHHLLIHLLKQQNLSRRQARWTEYSAEFDLQFDYIKGKENLVADALSRKQIAEDSGTVNGHNCLF
jgi:putative heme degradation protein